MDEENCDEVMHEKLPKIRSSDGREKMREHAIYNIPQLPQIEDFRKKAFFF